MLDQIKNLVKQYAGDAIIKNPAIPNERNEEAVDEASNSILGGLKNMLSTGNTKDILGMFSGKQNVSDSPVTQNISGGFVQSLMDKFGLDRSSANGVAEKVVPNVMESMVNKTNDPNDKSFDIQGIFNNLSGGSTSGFNMQSLLNKLKGVGLDKDGDGDVDVQDLMKLIPGGGGSGGGGILDKVKGMFN
jgi:uncharacterized protein YidB (DUF937 family)